MQLQALKVMRTRKKQQALDEEAAAIAARTEAELHAKFLSDVSSSKRGEEYVPVEFPAGVADMEGVFGRGINCVVKPSTIEGAGKGLFAARLLKKGSIIEFFDGRIYSTSAIRAWQDRTGRYCTHCIAFTLGSGGLTLDCSATDPTSVREMKGASFANSSARQFSNCETRLRISKAGTIVACLIAKSDIQPGTEIVYKYTIG